MKTDSEIIEQSLKAPQAFAELFDRHARVIGSFAAKRVGSDAAEDIVAETFLIAFRKRARFDRQRTNARPWLLGIAVNVIARNREAQAAHWRRLQGATALAVDTTPSAVDDIDRRVDAERELQELMPAINKLSARDRETLMLYAWGDMTYEDIAEALRVPVGTVRSRLNRVRKTLARSASRPAPPGAAHLAGGTDA